MPPMPSGGFGMGGLGGFGGSCGLPGSPGSPPAATPPSPGLLVESPPADGCPPAAGLPPAVLPEALPAEPELLPPSGFPDPEKPSPPPAPLWPFGSGASVLDPPQAARPARTIETLTGKANRRRSLDEAAGRLRERGVTMRSSWGQSLGFLNAAELSRREGSEFVAASAQHLRR
jgi:hypothetical protein